MTEVDETPEMKMYTYLKGYSNSREMIQTQKALVFARKMHQNQYRKEGKPFIGHPLMMACNALAMGMSEDNLIATVLLHDVCEDCGVLVEELPVNQCVRKNVGLVTFDILKGETKSQAKNRYYQDILQSREATITKLLDRCHNVSSMAHAFTKQKLRDYIKETREYVLPLQKKGKEIYPDLTDHFFVLKYHICSVIDSIEATMNLYEDK